MRLRSIIVFAFVVVACSTSKTENNQSGVPQLRDLSGNEIDLASYKGKTVFVNVWATWCAPCVKEMPSIQSAGNMLGDRVEILMASEEEVDRIKEFMVRKPFQLQFVQLLNADELLIPALPATYIIDPSGKVAFFEVGARKWDEPENIELINSISGNL